MPNIYSIHKSVDTSWQKADNVTTKISYVHMFLPDEEYSRVYTVNTYFFNVKTSYGYVCGVI